MMRRIVLIILMVAALVGAAVMLPKANKERDRLAAKTMIGAAEAAQDPTVTLLTNVLGGFKGILVDAAWLRSIQLQQENKFWELYQLYDWIGKLSPRLEEVWDFQLWNLAYNLTAEMNNGEARWQWLQKGVEFARDQGLKYNPESGRIMARLSWVFWHKIGKDTDNFHWYYKIRWAGLMNEVFGDFPYQDIPGIHAAPDSLDDLLRDPDVSAALANVAPEVLQQLDKAGTILVTTPRRQNSIPEPVLEALRDKPAIAWIKVRNYVSRRILRDTYKMRDFEIMENMEKEYGRFDWRLADPHGIYWGMLARRVEKKPKKVLEYDRLIMFGLTEGIRRGRIAYFGHINRGPNDPVPNQQMVTLTDLDKIPRVEALYAEYFEKYPELEIGGQSWRDGHMHFLQEAMTYLYIEGYRKEARSFFDRMKALYKDTEEKSLDEYILGRIKVLVDEQGTTAKIVAIVDGAIMQMLRAYARHNDNLARQQQVFAQKVWEAYVHAELKRLGSGPKVENTYPTYEQFEAYKVQQMVLVPGLMDPNEQKALRARLPNLTPAKPFEGIGEIPGIDESSPVPK